MNFVIFLITEGRPCSDGANCADKHPATRLIALNFERMTLGRCKWCSKIDPYHPAWECELAPAVESKDSTSTQSNDTTASADSSEEKFNPELLDLIVEILVKSISEEPTRCKHITALCSFLYLKYPHAKAVLQQAGIKLKGLIARYPNKFRYEAETLFVHLAFD